LIRQKVGNGRPVDAVERLQYEPGNRHQRPGIAGAHAGVGLAALDQLQSHAHRRIALGAQRHGGRIIHRDRLFRVHDRQPPRRRTAVDLAQRRFDIA